jgi:hypothetical protein
VQENLQVLLHFELLYQDGQIEMLPLAKNI